MLKGQRILVSGVVNESSIAYAVARMAQEQGAEVVLTSFGRAKRLTTRIAKRLPEEPLVLELDVTQPTDVDAIIGDLRERFGSLDGIVHAVAFAPPGCLAGNFLRAEWDDVSVALHVSTYSLRVMGVIADALMPPTGGSIVGLTFDASRAWPGYDWMGVAKAGLESASRYLARDLGRRGVRVNLVSAGPLRTLSTLGFPFFDAFAEHWGDQAPLGWDGKDATPVARACVALLSDWFPATTGDVIHVDGGHHAVGA